MNFSYFPSVIGDELLSLVHLLHSGVSLKAVNLVVFLVDGLGRCVLALYELTIWSDASASGRWLLLDSLHLHSVLRIWLFVIF